MLSKLEPSNGKLLISEPFLSDPNFARSVVLLAEVTESGVLGVVLNQKSPLMLADLMPDLPDNDFPVFIGGPVELNAMFFIHRCFDKIKGGMDIGLGLFWSTDFETVYELIENKELDISEIKFFIGYSGWQSDQLKDELKENTWIVSDQYHPDVVFSDNEEVLWRDVIVNLGPKYAHIVNFPQNPNLN